MAKKGLRTVALAFKEINASHARAGIDGSETPSGLTLLTLVGIKDPVRPEVTSLLAWVLGLYACWCVCGAESGVRSSLVSGWASIPDHFFQLDRESRGRTSELAAAA